MGNGLVFITTDLMPMIIPFFLYLSIFFLSPSLFLTSLGKVDKSLSKQMGLSENTALICNRTQSKKLLCFLSRVRQRPSWLTVFLLSGEQSSSKLSGSRQPCLFFFHSLTLSVADLVLLSHYPFIIYNLESYKQITCAILGPHISIYSFFFSDIRFPSQFARCTSASP